MTDNLFKKDLDKWQYLLKTSIKHQLSDCVLSVICFFLTSRIWKETKTLQAKLEKQQSLRTEQRKNTLCSISNHQRNEQRQKATFHLHNVHAQHCNLWLPRTSSAPFLTAMVLMSLQDNRGCGGPCNLTTHRLQSRAPPLWLVGLLWFCLFYSSLSQFVVEQHAPSQMSRRPWCNDSVVEGDSLFPVQPQVCLCLCQCTCVSNKDMHSIYGY